METNHQNGSGNVHGCNEWNTCYEEKINRKTNDKNRKSKTTTPTLLNDAKGQNTSRISTGFDELNRVLGGGLVIGSLTLLGRRARHR